MVASRIISHSISRGCGTGMQVRALYHRCSHGACAQHAKRGAGRAPWESQDGGYHRSGQAQLSPRDFFVKVASTLVRKTSGRGVDGRATFIAVHPFTGFASSSSHDTVFDSFWTCPSFCFSLKLVSFCFCERWDSQRASVAAMAERTLLAKRTQAFTPSPIQQLSLLAQRCNAINLAEGFPDFPAPPNIKEAAVAAIRSDFNQYRHVQGVCEKVAEAFERAQGVRVDAATQITICCGQSEAMAAAVFAVVEEGDEVVLLDPVYETYHSCIILAGGTPRFVSLNPPHWSLDIEKLEGAFGPKTKAIVINSPHNPTGKAFTTNELADIASLCCKYGCLAITDEVYEHIVFDRREHVSIASFPGMQERTIVTSSLSKTFSVTGWRIGWAIAPADISAAIGNIHVKMTDSAPAPFQEAALVALQSTPSFFTQLKQDYEERRDYACEMLSRAGFSNFLKPEGSFFIFAELPQACPLNDVEYVKELIQGAGVAVVPGRGFFHQDQGPCNGEKVSGDKDSDNGAIKSGDNPCFDNHRTRYVRIAFCKDMTSLKAASTAIRKHLALVDPNTGHIRHPSGRQSRLDQPHFFS